MNSPTATKTRFNGFAEAKRRCPRHGDGTGPPCYSCRPRSEPIDMPWDSQAELELLRDGMRRDFWMFFCYGFGALLNPKGRRWVEPAVHYPLCDWFQQHVLAWKHARDMGRGEQKHLAIIVPREVGKTTTITEAGQLWLHLLDPEISTATGSESMKLSNKILAAMKGVLDGSDEYGLFARLFGSWASSSRKWAGTEIVHAARKNTARTDPSLFTFAVETSITGAHPDVIFYDDPISYERLSTDTNWLATVNSQVDSLIPVLQGDGLRIFVGTRYDDADHFGTVFESDGIASVSGLATDSLVPADGGMWHIYFLAGRDTKGQPVIPKVWDDARMRSYQKKNPLRYAAQVMNDPTLSETNPITRDQLKQCTIKKESVPWNELRFAVCCDTAFAKPTSRPGKDWSVMIVHGYPRDGSGDVYVVECHGSPHWRAEDFGAKLVALVQRYRTQGRKVFAITDEMESGGKVGAWRAGLRNFFSDRNEPMPNFLQFDRQLGPKKIERIERATTFWVDGHVKVIENAPGVQMLMEQMAKVGQLRVNPRMLKDFVDAHADAFRPELYVPMRRQANQRAPYEHGASALPVSGMDGEQFNDSGDRRWLDENPRPPLN